MAEETGAPEAAAGTAAGWGGGGGSRRREEKGEGGGRRREEEEEKEVLAVLSRFLPDLALDVAHVASFGQPSVQFFQGLSQKGRLRCYSNVLGTQQRTLR